jgi:hypothetical protein
MGRRTDFLGDDMATAPLEETVARLRASREPFVEITIRATMTVDGRERALGFIWHEREGEEKFTLRANCLRFCMTEDARRLRGDYGSGLQRQAERGLAETDLFPRSSVS